MRRLVLLSSHGVERIAALNKFRMIDTMTAGNTKEDQKNQMENKRENTPVHPYTHSYTPTDTPTPQHTPLHPNTHPYTPPINPLDPIQPLATPSPHRYHTLAKS